MMEQDPDNVKLTYDAVAEEYSQAFLNEHEKKPKDGEILRKFARMIADRSPIWDFGCGPGQTTEYLNRLGVAIAGLDLSEKMLEQAKKLHPELFFRNGNILALDFDSGSIAGVVAFYAIVHFTKEQVKSAFREIFRVLQPGGIFLLAFHVGEETLHIEEFLGKKVDIDFMYFTTDFISGCLREYGFEQLEIIERESYPEVEYPSRRAYLFALKPNVR